MTILSEIAAQLPDNNSEQITPAILRGVLNDMVADYGAVASADASAAQTAAQSYTDGHIAGLAPLASPAFTGNPTAPSQTLGDNSTKIANTAFVAAAIAALINSAPGALDTLKELADALGDDPNFATTVTNALALKAPLASPALTGTPTVPTAAVNTNTTQAASTAFVIGQAGTATPQAPGTAAAGSATKFSREDHVHAPPSVSQLSDSAWTSYTPASITSGSGAFTTVSAAGRYKQIGKTVHLQVVVTVTNAGTAASTLTVSLPITAAAFAATGYARETVVSGNSGPCYIAASGTTVNAYQAGGGTLIATGAVIVFGITYEVP